jgi:signal transduction histidine kinase
MNLWIGTSKGLFRFTPEPETSRPAPPILITKLTIAGEEQPISELGEKLLVEPDLEVSRNNLQIEFVSPNFSFTTTQKYEYKLEGADADWSPPTLHRAVNYANLSPGRYRFMVRAVRADGSSSEAPAVMSFMILPPIWQRWWFVTGALVLMAIPAAAFGRYRYHQRKAVRAAQQALRKSREERLAELERVRGRIAADLHDDIGSNLTRISLISEVAQRKLDGADPPVGEHLSSIGKLSRELVDSMSDIVWAINPHKDHLADLSQRMRHFASDLFTARQVQFRFTAVDFDRDIQVGANLRREFFLIFKEGVNNIARHSACTEAEIELLTGEDNLVLILSDNGKGFDLSKSSTGHGLVSMRERTRALGGELEMSSTPGQGAILRFVIPLHPHTDDFQQAAENL